MVELERRIIDSNIYKLKTDDDIGKLVTRLTEMKNKFNELVRAKAELQQELINSEEEKLKVSKALIELQIENMSLTEQI